MSTSDIPDEPPFRYSVDDSFILGARPGSIETLPSMSSLASSSGDVRKSKGRSLFRRRNRNSIRRKSEPGLAKHGIKKPEKSEIKPSRSTEGERADLRIGDWGGGTMRIVILRAIANFNACSFCTMLSLLINDVMIS